MVRFQIKLDEASFNALRNLAEQEYRALRFQAALLIKESLVQRGLLSHQGKNRSQLILSNQKKENGQI